MHEAETTTLTWGQIMWEAWVGISRMKFVLLEITWEAFWSLNFTMQDDQSQILMLFYQLTF